MQNKIIPETGLKKFGDVKLLTGKALALLEQQKTVWELLKKNYAGLEKIHIKNFNFNDIRIRLQFNPGRIRSTSAKVDPESIKERKCFLCIENLPDEQMGIPFNDDFLILCNPFPIFKEHFTIVNKMHVPQTIFGNFLTFLQMVKELGDKLTVFYNGPKCGASAPDHMHFQAGSKGVMPIESEYDSSKEKFGKIIYEEGNAGLFAVDDNLRKMFFLEGAEEKEIESVFYKLIGKMQELLGIDDEPMLNIVGMYENNKWKLIIFPRAKHRPDYFFLNDSDKIMISPASVDMSGLMIVPRDEDFEKIDKEKIIKIFDQVCFGKNAFYELTAM